MIPLYQFSALFSLILVVVWITKVVRFMWWVLLGGWGEGVYSRGGPIKHSKIKTDAAFFKKNYYFCNHKANVSTQTV